MALATFANPFLKPEQDFTGEVNIERKWNDGRVRLTLFKERTNDAIISQIDQRDELYRWPNAHHDNRQRRCNPDAGCRAVG